MEQFEKVKEADKLKVACEWHFSRLPFGFHLGCQSDLSFQLYLLFNIFDRSTVCEVAAAGAGWLFHNTD